MQTLEDIAALADTLFQRSEEREEREVNRLHQMLALIQQDDCQVARLCRYFGETLDTPCGHCTWCLGEHAPQVVPGQAAPDIDAETWQ